MQETDLAGHHPVRVHPGVRASQDTHTHLVGAADRVTVAGHPALEPGGAVVAQHALTGVAQDPVDESGRRPRDPGGGHRPGLAVLDDGAVLDAVEPGIDGLLEGVLESSRAS